MNNVNDRHARVTKITATISVIGQYCNTSIEYLDKSIDIAGQVISGSLNLNGKSSLRRTGSLSIFATSENCRITEIDNIISMNKIIELKIQENNNDYFLGRFVIENASTSKSTSGWTINVTIHDLMALLNGTIGGNLPGGATHSPVLVKIENPGSGYEYIEEKVDYRKIIAALLTDFAPWATENMKIDLGQYENSEDENEPLQISQQVTWIGEKVLNIQQIGTETPSIYAAKLSESPLKDYSSYVSGDIIGYQKVLFTYPGELTSSAGESIASILEKIAKELGNYEFYFDTTGHFHFEEIPNGLYQGSEKYDLEQAISDVSNSYLTGMKLKEEDENNIPTFTDYQIISSFTDNPNYKNIKNDLVVWGKVGSLPIRYRLIIDNIDEKKEENSNWRLSAYNGDTFFTKELRVELPKIMDVDTGEWITGSDSNSLKNLTYFIDILDPECLEGSIDPEAEDYSFLKHTLTNITVSKIGLRTKAFPEDKVNCIFLPPPANIFYIPKGQEDTAKLREQAIKEEKSFIQVDSEIAKNIGGALGSYSAYDCLRSKLHDIISFCNSIVIQCLPLYDLEPNTLIRLNMGDISSDGVYQVNSLTVPLDEKGMMTINASRMNVMI